ncbi:MAG: phosphoribosylformylglycinamidine synthase I [bacterium]|nr:phosphoribosylformylglycinamidine synthase I [bacterium]
MSRPRVHVLYAPGTNCHFEMMDAFRLAGAEPSLRLLTDDLIRGKVKLSDCDLIAIPGGFSFGDHIAAGRIFALDLVHRLRDGLLEAGRKRIPMIGVCNGFQVLVNTGLLPGTSGIGSPDALLDRNRVAVFVSRWVTLHVQAGSACVWTKGLEGQSLRMPTAHGEGRLCVPDGFDDRNTVFRYGSAAGTEDYPANPNGSPRGRAGICDPTGRVLGLMPHPERAIYPWLGCEDGLAIFKTGVEAVR